MTYEAFLRQYNLALNPQQAEAVQSADGNVLLLAVPGSGKTTVLVARLGYLIHCCGVAPERILTMTYTISATADMRRRAASMFGQELAERLEFRTINGVCARIIRSYERSFGTTAFELLTDEKEISMLLTALYRGILEEHPTESEIKAVRSMITYVKNMQLREDAIEALDKELKGFPQIYHAYQKELRSRSRMDYDDQMVYAYAILRRYPALLQQWQQAYPYLCVDEAQDTSKIQHRIVDLLAQGSGNLFMVGDEDQSIYGFRAAYPKALVQFEQNHANAKVLLMEQNYRSTNQIVEAADRFIRLNKQRHPKQMTAVRGDGAAVREIQVHNRLQQYRYLAKVAANCDRETAVLYRDNDCALPLIDLLLRQGVGYRCRQVDSSFFTGHIVRDITNIIRFAQDQTNGPLFLDLYYKLNTHLSREEAKNAVRDCPEDMSILEFLVGYRALSGHKKKQCKALQTHMRNMLTENAADAVYRISKYMGYGEYLNDRGADTQKLDILQALGEAEATPAALLDRLDTLREIVQSGSADSESQFLLSTIHSSKGLEYDRVYLMDVADGILPADDEEETTLEEERRLFYVGMTRAKNELNIFTFKSREISSQFTSFVFPKSEPSKPRPGVKPPSASQEVQWASKDYIPGVRIHHRVFGPGIITARRDETIDVRFDAGDSLSLLLPVCLQFGLLSLKND